VVVRHEGDEVTVEVRDTGCGIPHDNLARIFEPFFSTKSRTVGTGLGLPISRKIIQDMGGRIDVRSQVGQGSSFIVRLRAAPSAVVTVPAETLVALVDDEVPELRVLVADDEPVIRRAVGRALRRCSVVEAESGEDARRILVEDRNFDLILCDMMMPRMSGVELHQWLSQVDPALARRMVFITGGAFTAPAQAFLQRAEVNHLEKPFSSATLRRVVREVAGAGPGAEGRGRRKP